MQDDTLQDAAGLTGDVSTWNAPGGIDLERLLEAGPVAPEPSGPLTYDEVLAPYVIVFCIAFVFSYVFTPIMRRVAVLSNIVDSPDGGRKLHTRPVAYLGGVAIFIGMIVSLALGQFFSAVHSDGGSLRFPAPIFAGLFVITGLGLIDDVRGVRPVLKILGQVAAAVCLLLFGVGDDVLGQITAFFFEWLHVNLSLQVPMAVEAATATVASWGFVIALVVFCCNASNLMDGLDGLCGGVTAIIAAGLVFVTASVALMSGTPATDAVRVALALALFGAVLGFLPFNFNPASIFMGDAGSLLMGFVVAVSIILLGDAGAKWMLGGLVMFSLPVLDTALAFARRWTAGRPLFSADKHHFHHQLINRNLSVRQAVVVSYALTIFFVAAGAMLVFFRTRYAVAFYLVLFGSIIVAAYKMGMVHERIRVGPEAEPEPEPEPADGPLADAVAPRPAEPSASPSGVPAVASA
ncbi:MAG: MraY family glycosyltransferase [Planctomycetota bacterium]